MRRLAIPATAEPWSLTSLCEKFIKIGAKVVSHGRYLTFQMTEVAVPRQMFADILMLIARLRAACSPPLRKKLVAVDGQKPDYSPSRCRESGECRLPYPALRAA
jgi:hypothetical protein